MAADGANEGGESAKSPSPFGEWEYTQMKRAIAKAAAPQNARSRLLSSHIPNVSFTPRTAMDEGRPRSCPYPLPREVERWAQRRSGPRGIRTPDLMAASHALYQLSYGPEAVEVYPADAASDPSSQPTRGASLQSRSRS